MTRLETVDGKNWEAFLTAPVAFLMLGKSDCQACNAWTEELRAFLETDERYGHVRFGKMLLDRGGLASFKKANSWIQDVHDLPFNVIYVGGEQRKTFAGGGLQRLLNRLERLGVVSAAPPSSER